jgi:hypothetical protein
MIPYFEIILEKNIGIVPRHQTNKTITIMGCGSAMLIIPDKRISNSRTT